MLKYLIGALLTPSVTEYGIAFRLDITTESGGFYHVEIEHYERNAYDVIVCKDGAVLIQNGGLNFTTGSTFVDALHLANDAIAFAERHCSIASQ